MSKNDTRKGAAPGSGFGNIISRDLGTGRFTDSKLPATFRVYVADGKSFSVVRRDVLDGAIAGNSKK